MSEEKDELTILNNEKDNLVIEYCSALHANDKAAVLKLETLFDGLYWRYLEVILRKSVVSNQENLEISEDDRLLIDFGLLDENLVADAAPNLRERLLEEHSSRGMLNHYYLSEWLEERYKNHRITLNLEAELQINEDVTSKFAQSRTSTYNRISPLFKSLQGVTAQMAELVSSGRLDMQLIHMGADLLGNKMRQDFMQRHRLWQLRQTIFARAKGRTSDARLLKFFDIADNLYSLEWRDVFNETINGPRMTAEERWEEEKKKRRKAAEEALENKLMDFLIGELRFIRTLFPLGAFAGGIMRSCSVLTSDKARVTKKHTEKILQRVNICDRNYGASPVILIAPFTGRGIYEWDRDSLVIGLSPSTSPEDSTSHAVANYTMMLDSLQKEGKLKNAYTERFPTANYQQDFQTDYRCWLCEVAEGKEESMDAEKLRFFREKVGLDLAYEAAISLAPTEMRLLGPQARHLIRIQLSKQVMSAKDSWQARWRLGLISWLEGDGHEALKELTHAAKLMPQNINILMGVALLLAETGRIEKARELFSICKVRGKNSIWKLYAEDALNKIN